MQKENLVSSRVLRSNAGYVLTPNELYDIFGRIPSALLQQIHYWSTTESGVIVDGRRWIYNTLEDWAKQLKCSTASVTRALKILKSTGVIIIRRLHKNRSNRTNYYAINYESLDEKCSLQNHSIDQNDSSCSIKMIESLTKRKPKVLSYKSEQVGRASPPQEFHMHDQDEKQHSENTMEKFLKNMEKRIIEETVRRLEGIVKKTTEDAVGKLITKLPVKPEFDQDADEPQKEREAQSSITKAVDKKSKIEPEKPIEKRAKEAIEIVEKSLCEASRNLSDTILPLRNNTAQEMANIWNKHVIGEQSNLLKLNKQRACFMVSAFQKKFNENMDDWKMFCQMVASSDFLMGRTNKKFKLGFDWFLKYDSIDKILDGMYGCKKTEKSTFEMAKESAVKMKDIIAQETNSIIQRLKEAVLRVVDAPTFLTWLEPCKWVVEDDKTIKLIAQTGFCKERIKTYYESTIREVSGCNVLVVC